MNTNFSFGLRKLFFSAISTINLSDNVLIAFGWDNSSVRLLKLVLVEEIIEEKELLADIHLRLKVLGRRSFDQHKNLNQYPDHTYSPHALAYAIQNNEFTDEERLSIKYDHGEDDLEFTKLYNSGDLRQHVLNQLLTEREPVNYGPSDTHCLCC